MYKIDRLTGRIFNDRDEEIPQDDREDVYLAYLLWLSGDRAPEVFDAPPPPLTPAKELAAAKAWGSALVDDFMTRALANGVNDRGLAGPLFAWLAVVSAALASGALHAAEQLLGELLKTPEEERPARPYTDDASLGPVHAAISERIGQLNRSSK